MLGRRAPTSDLGFLPAQPSKRSKNNDGEDSDSDADLFKNAPVEEVKEVSFKDESPEPNEENEQEGSDNQAPTEQLLVEN